MVADAGSPEEITPGQDDVELSGSGYTVPDSDIILNYEWTQTAGPSVDIDQASPTSGLASFDVPDTMEEDTELTFVLTVSYNPSDTETITYTVASPPPTCEDDSASTTIGTEVTLDVLENDDPEIEGASLDITDVSVSGGGELLK